MHFLIAFLLFAQPTSRVHFINRTEVALTLTVDGTDLCSADSMGECEADVAYGAHHLAASFHGKEIITREAPAQEKVQFAVCHQSDTDPVCKPKS